MKKVLILSLVVFLGWCFGCPLCAQSCQPSPACKAICAQKKADAASVDAAPAAIAQTVSNKKSCAAASAKTSVSEVQIIPVNFFAPGTSANAKTSLNCNPEDCDPSKCDWSKCDLSKCDLSKCKPANCTGSSGKAAVRL